MTQICKILKGTVFGSFERLTLRLIPLLLLTLCTFLSVTASTHVFADSTINVTISIQGLPTSLSTAIYLNGNYNQTLSGGASTTYALSSANGPYIISVDSLVPGGVNGTRYYCQNMTRQTGTSGIEAFTYVAEYLLTIQSAFGSDAGQGWYQSGATAHATVSTSQVTEGQGTRNIFNGWSGDAAGSATTSDPIAMTAPRIAIANWRTQFFLTLESYPNNASSLSGSGWYDEGTQANFSAPMTIPLTSNTRLQFNHWSGEAEGEQPSGNVSMDRPKTVQANYVPQYLLAITYNPATISNSYNETGVGWYDTNSDVQLGPAPTVINLSPVERLRFTGWTDNDSTSANLTYAVLMNAPRNVTLAYVTQYYLTVQSTYGPVTGSGWYDKGVTALINAPTSAGTWPIVYTMTGWNVNPSSQTPINNGNSWKIIVNGPYTVQANWSLNYFPLIMLSAIGGAAATATTGVAVGYRRGGLGRKRLTPPKQESTAIVTQPNSDLRCTKCGTTLSANAEFCEECGNAVGQKPDLVHDNLVYDYIVNHGGVISLSIASKDLGVDMGQLKEITERLKREGKLS